MQGGEEPDAADSALLASLEVLVKGEDAAPTVPATAEPEGDITDAEFEQFLSAIAEPGESEAPAASVVPIAANDSHDDSNNEITDDEFESLLDDIHGKGKHGSVPTAEAAPTANDSDAITDDEFEALLNDLHGGAAPGSEKASEFAAAKKGAAAAPATAADDDIINDNEFEALLDQLHGKGQGPTTAAPTPPAAEKTEPAAKPPPGKKTPTAQVAAEKKPAPAKKTPTKEGIAAAEATVRVDTQRLDDIMNMVGELVLVRNRLVRLGAKSGDEVMTKAVSNLDVVTADLQTAVMKTRMQPIKKVFGRFPRVVRDLARNLKKEITLELEGEETDLDKNLVEALADPLVHLVRNSVDHGIEMPDDRERVGKPRVGKIVLAAEQEGDHILLSITDDGSGMDPNMLRQKAIEKGLFDEDVAARLSDSECFNIIFMPGFSTKTEISDVSGRGVGMDVVKTKITQLNGSVEITSKVGEGTRLEIKVPLTLAIMPTLMVMLGEQAFAFPLVSVNEIFHMDLTRTNVVDGQEVVTVRDKALPLFYLKQWLVDGTQTIEPTGSAHVVIVTVGTQRVGFVVDQLIGQEEVVIKPLGKMLQGTPGMAGATITGDGRIALILDVPSMLKRYAG